MNRRNLLLGIAAAPIAGTANALSWSDVKEAITGHTTDLIDRYTEEDTFAPGQPIMAGSFREDDPGQDAAHWVKGSVYLMEGQGTNYIQLGQDFEAGLAPDLYIYASAMPDIVDEESFFNSHQVELGKLIKGTGASFYELPDGLSPKSVTIWCKRFSQFMGSANL